MSDREQTKAHCNRCMGSTNHLVLHKHLEEWQDADAPVSGGDEYFLLKCAGCDSVRLKHDNWFSEDTDECGDQKVKTNYYPPAVSRRSPRWLNNPEGPFYFGATEVEKLLEEIYSALQNGSRRLVAMGVRALLETVMIEQVGDSGQIGTNVANFLAQGHVAEKNKEVFRFQIIEAGHAAMHRNYVPTKQDLEVLLDISEALIESVYVHPHMAKRMVIPVRHKIAKP